MEVDMEIVRPLFFYKLDVDTGEINKIYIYRYDEGKFTNGKGFYRWKGSNGMTYYCYSTDVDRAKDWRLYTFTDNDSRARQLLEQYVREKYEKYEKEAKRFERVLKLMRKYKEQTDG